MIRHIEPEFSRPVAVEPIGRGEAVETIEASPAERAALARRFGLNGLDRLAAELRLRRGPGGQIITVEGRLEADVVLTCVVTLEPFPAHIEDSFSARFIEPKGGRRLAESDFGDELEEAPEEIEGDSIDIGELVAQHLSLAIDPYPRAPEARFDYRHESGAADTPESMLITPDRFRGGR